MRLWFALSAVLATIVVMSAAGTSAKPRTAAKQTSDCMVDPLGPLPGYSVITNGDFSEQNTESDGRMVVGGKANLVNFGVATKLPVDRNRVDLATGGDLLLNS